ncbi:hypothetical protein A2U01_0054675, partial [Trifolium medium]|nr:hypothetical protein [Trifolium medium]
KVVVTVLAVSAVEVKPIPVVIVDLAVWVAALVVLAVEMAPEVEQIRFFGLHSPMMVAPDLGLCQEPSATISGLEVVVETELRAYMVVPEAVKMELKKTVYMG